MDRSFIRVLALVFLITPTLFAIEKPFQPGKILEIQQKYKEQVLYYLVNTPVYREEPYFEVAIQVKDAVLVGEYTPLHPSETLPASWQIDSPVQVRLRDKHHMALNTAGERQIEFLVLRREPLASEGSVYQASGHQ